MAKSFLVRSVETAIPLQLTFKRKPYLTCNDCGLQLFIRGQTGIERLQKLISKGKFIAGQETNASEPLALINRLEKLQVQKRDLETKQGLIFKNEAVSDAITVIEAEISKIEQELKARAKGKGKLKGKLK